MPDFHYSGLDPKGKPADGHVAAESREQALAALRRQGITPTNLRILNGASVANTGPVAGPSKGGLFQSRATRLGSDDVLSFIKELGGLLRAGLPLDRSLRVLSETQPHPGLKKLQLELLDAVKAGRSFSQALGQYPEHFGPLHVNLVRAGEVSGKLAGALQYLAEHLDRSKALRSSLVSALTYPAILLVTAVISVALMLGFVVPQFKPMFNDLGDRLPFLTQWVVAMGDVLVQYGVALLIGALAVWVLLSRWWATAAGGAQRERLLLAIPVLGSLLYRYQLSQFTRTLGSLLSSGVALMQAVVIARDGLRYATIRARLEPLTGAIKQGQRFSKALADCGVLDPASVQLLALGEETGRLDAMLGELTQRHEESIQLQTRRALTLLEPLIILGLGMVVAAIIIAILLGILSVNELVA